MSSSRLKFVTRLASALAIGVVLQLMLQTSAGLGPRAVAAYAAPRGCLMVFMGPFACYPPRQAQALERAMMVAPVSPSETVTRLTGLKLRQIVAVGASAADGGAQPILGLYYLFGTFPRWNPSKHAWLPTHYRFVVVAEIAERVSLPDGEVVDVGGGDARIESGAHGEEFKPKWDLYANFSHRDLSLHVFSNLSRSAVVAAARELFAIGDVVTPTPRS